MIPKVLLELIDKYNEIGVFTISDAKIYWFNGKRFEMWCDIPPQEAVNAFVYKRKLYIRYSFETYIYKNKQFRLPVGNDIIKNSHPYGFFSHFYNLGSIKIKNCFFAYEYNDFFKFDKGIWQMLPKKQIKCCYKIYYYKNELYCFSNWGNEKFNILTNEWSSIANNFYSFDDILFINNIFYSVRNCKLKEIYNFETNKWEKKYKIILTKEI